MRIVHVIVYLFLASCVVLGEVFADKEKNTEKKWKIFLKEHLYLLVLLLVANTVSFGMTFLLEDQDIYIEKNDYGEEEIEIPLLLQKGEEKEEIHLTVSARQLQPKELEERVAEAFVYLEENMKGNNESLDKVYEELDYFLDVERFPFDAEFISEDYALVDEEGTVKNDRGYLLSLGFTELEINNGIPIHINVTLWYGDESFQQTYSLRIFARNKSKLDQEFATVREVLSDAEKKAFYDEGFYVPRVVNGIQVSRIDKDSVSPEQILIAGIVLVVLLLLREQENKRKEAKLRKDNLIRSYPWFVNELVLLLGAGMHIRNILSLLIKDYENGQDSEDYRKPLMEELRVAVRAIEFGMTEEQAYYKLGRRIGIPSYVKIMTLLEQNVKRGGKGLIAVLEQEEVLALEERKNLAKRYGEEAGTKLLGPMILLLVVVMLMIMIPAFWGFVS